MIFRLGYVAMVLDLVDCSPSGTVTAAVYSKLSSIEAKLYRLRKVSARNLENTLRILRYNKAYNISVYRLTSKLIPLATYEEAEAWDYAADLAEQFKEIGDFIKENDFRVSAHPDHFTLLNSMSGKVLENSIKDLDYHVRVYEAMGLSDYRYKLVLHVGGLYKDKKYSLERFKENYRSLPDRIRKRITIENDDKSYNAADVLGLCLELGVPMVLDVHHHRCLNNGERLEDLLPDIFSTWRGQYFKPKVHVSSPKSEKDFRSHADYIDFDEFSRFIDRAAGAGTDFDVMVEAKAKNLALLKLSEQLRGVGGIRCINNAEFEI